MKLFGYEHHKHKNPMERARPSEIELYHMLVHIIVHQETHFMALTAEIQKVIDDIAANTSIAKSSAAALKLEAQQITDLQAQIAALQAGTVLSAEDKAALVQGAADLEQTNTDLQAAVPAGT
jgi:hypothetical protein